MREERVAGAIVATRDGEVEVSAACGVVLPTGGFAHDAVRRAALFPVPDQHWTLAVPSATGDGLRLGERVGGSVDATLASPGAWCPVSLVPDEGRGAGRFPHIIERSKLRASACFTALLQQGQRLSRLRPGRYSRRSLRGRRSRRGSSARARSSVATDWAMRDPCRCPRAVCAQRILEDRPHDRGALRVRIGDAAGLERTIAQYNEHARRGEDPVFDAARRSGRYQGDARRSQSVRRADRGRAVLRGQGAAGELRHVRRPAYRRARRGVLANRQPIADSTRKQT